MRPWGHTYQVRADGEQCSLEFGEDNLILRHTNQPDLVVPLVALAGAEWEDAGRVSSGRLTVMAGATPPPGVHKRFKLRFSRKQQDQMRIAYEALVERVARNRELGEDPHLWTPPDEKELQRLQGIRQLRAEEAAKRARREAGDVATVHYESTRPVTLGAEKGRSRIDEAAGAPAGVDGGRRASRCCGSSCAALDDPGIEAGYPCPATLLAAR